MEVTNFGSNPGKLKMFRHIPDQMPASAALVVVMHGCKQNARTFTDESGWTLLSDKLHVALARAHPVVPGWSICSMRVACAGDQRRAEGTWDG